MVADIIADLSRLYSDLLKENPSTVTPLPVSGSSRKYFRIAGPVKSVMGAYNPDIKENRAFLYLSRHFQQAGLAVPEVYVTDPSNKLYLLQDLGDTTLYSLLNHDRSAAGLSDENKARYFTAVKDLPDFQVKGHPGLDYSYCYPRAAFDKQSMLWDLNYFKYYFLKLAGITFDEQDLEDDFQDYSNLLSDLPSEFFMYRDFQSRNIMVKDSKLYYIDYQGGRKGSRYYDLASLLYDAKADLSADFRQELLEVYQENDRQARKKDPVTFTNEFYLFVYIRLMQAMGAYGFRGFYEKKEIFLQSIPYALKNLTWLLEHHPLPDQFNTLNHVLHALPGSAYLKSLGKPGLHVIIRSFSYKKGIPADTSIHGGGFVFDCRALPNPGRYSEYQSLTGLDQTVIDFLSKEKEVDDFLFNVFNIVDQSVKNYLSRNFEKLTVNFGCTGGQHRSVFLAEKLKKHLVENFQVNVTIEHTEL